MNGRQIDNAIISARQYAEQKSHKMTITHLLHVIDGSEEFVDHIIQLSAVQSDIERVQSKELQEESADDDNQ